MRRSKSIRNYEMVIKLLLLLLHQHLRLTDSLLGIDKILKFIGISDYHHLHKFPIYRNKINIWQGIIFHWGINLGLTTIHKLNYFRLSTEKEMLKEEICKIIFLFWILDEKYFGGYIKSKNFRTIWGWFRSGSWWSLELNWINSKAFTEMAFRAQ